MQRLARILFAACLGAACIGGAANAQAPDREQGVSRTQVCRADLTGQDGAPNGMEAICSMVEIAPGGGLPRHVHHGVETAYVLADTTVQYPGQPLRKIAAGTVLAIPRDQVHSGFTVVGDQPMRLYTVHIIDKDKPFADPVK